MTDSRRGTSGIRKAAGACARVTAVPMLLIGFLILATSSSVRAQDPEKPTTRIDSCSTRECHPGYSKAKVKHPPAANDQCLTCHDYASPEHHLFKLTRPKKTLCYSCHISKDSGTIHTPVANGDCVSCHDPHGSEHEMLLVAEPQRELCMTCHEQDYEEMEYVHGPVAVGACTLCHSAHSSSQKALLNRGPDQLCASCHARVVPKGPEKARQHQPMADGCMGCHDPHASNNRGQLKEPVPTQCFECHDEMKDALADYDVVHGPALQERGCVMCHNPHHSLLPKLQRSTQPGICMSCHDEELKTADGDVLPSMADLLTDNPNHHGPIREGGCTECHNPHGEDHFRLLFQDYPAEFYAPFEKERYALCFSCHQADMVLDPSGTGLTGFRDGDENLHWLHVNQEKGRTCRACHEVHASKRPFHMRESVPFGDGNWPLEINFEVTEEGGRCLPACHKKREYSRTKLTAPENLDPDGATNPNVQDG